MNEARTPGNIIEVIKEILDKSRIIVDGILTFKTTKSFLQGSCLSLILFNFYINFMFRNLEELNSWCRVYADDIVQWCAKKMAHVQKKWHHVQKKWTMCKKMNHVQKNEPCAKKKNHVQKKNEPCAKKNEPCAKKWTMCKKWHHVQKNEPCAKKMTHEIFSKKY